MRETCPVIWYGIEPECHTKIVLVDLIMWPASFQIQTIKSKVQWPTEYRTVGIQMVIFWTLLKSGFQMVKGSHFVKKHSKTRHSCLVFNKMAASLDHFIVKKIFVLLIKQSRLANRTRMSGFQKPGTGWNRRFECRTSPVFGGSLYSEH
jgi:predicted RNA binding protein YcfA (HicA-like mRNA interferase family)